MILGDYGQTPIYVDYANVDLVITDGDKKRCIRVVKNYVSRYGFWGMLITQSPYYTLGRNSAGRVMDRIGTWNEDVYQNDYGISFKMKK